MQFTVCKLYWLKQIRGWGFGSGGLADTNYMHAKQFYPQKTQHWMPYIKCILAVIYQIFLTNFFFFFFRNYNSACQNNRPKGSFLSEVGISNWGLSKVPPSGLPLLSHKTLRHIQRSLEIMVPRLRIPGWEPSQLHGWALHNFRLWGEWHHLEVCKAAALGATL